MTYHDSMATTDLSPSPVIRARALTGFALLLERHGGDPAEALRRVGFAQNALDDLEAPLPMARVALLLEQAARSLPLDDFGMQLAQLQDTAVMGPLAIVVRYAANLGEACQVIARSIRYHSSGAVLLLEEDTQPGFVRLRYDLSLPSEVPRRQAIELSYAWFYRLLKMLSGQTGENWRLLFRHPQGLLVDSYRQHFACPVSLGQSVDALCFPQALLQCPIDPENQQLRVLAERYAANVVRRHALDIDQQVVALASRQLASGGATIERIAKQLGMHPRTLQRRLREQGLCFEQLLDQLKKSRAEEYLAYAAIPIPEIAALVGYSEPSPFFRACRRWFGVTPRAYRAGLNAEPSTQ